MFISASVVRHDREIIVETCEVRGLSPLLAVAMDELFCTHHGKTCAEGFCLLDPPAWTWYVGFGRRASLGTLLWKTGQWAAGYPHPVTETRAIDQDQATTVWGWDPVLLAESLTLFDED